MTPEEKRAEVIATAGRYAEELSRTAQRTRAAIAQSRVTFGDRALIFARVASYSSGLPGIVFRELVKDPSTKALLTLAGARRLASEVYFRTQRDLFEKGTVAKLQETDQVSAKKIEDAYFDLNAAVQEALAEETTWGTLPERIADTAMDEIFSGFLRAIMDLLAQLLRMLENIGKAALGLIDILEVITRYAMPIALGVAALYVLPLIYPRVKSLVRSR